MATRNSWWQPILLLSLIANLLACQNMGKSQRPVEKNDPQPIEIPQNPELQPTVDTPQFLEKEPPKLGIILGPGGALSFSQIGVLQELENQKINVHSIAGIEWGALVAGAYATNKKAHGIEWKLLKLPHKKFSERGFFSGKNAPKVGDFESYLAKVFEGNTFRDAEIGFSCPYINLNKESFGLYTKGRLKNAVKVCWPSSPHFKIQSVGADYSGVHALAEYMRSQGAELIVYVDVLSRNSLVKKSERLKNSGATLNLVQAKSMVGLFKKPLVDEVIRVPLNGQNISSYKALRSIIRLGQIKSKESVKEIAKKYAY